MKKWKNALLMTVLCPILLTACTTQEQVIKENKETVGEEKEESVKKNTAPTIVTMGHHNVKEVDPSAKDPVTGEPYMDPDRLRASEEALQVVRDELNVELQFIEYDGNPTEVLLQSVLAGDPVCDIAWLWNTSQGAILSQNILQSLNEYEYLFEEDDEWMLWDEIMDNRFFLNKTMEFVPRWPLIYNINYIEEVDALKENGKTVYPTDLFLKGEWTWSVFEDYLAKIDAHFQNKQAPIRKEKRIEAYQTDYREAVLHAAHSNGGGIYTSKGLEMASDETKEAVKYIERLMDKGLLTCERADPNRSEPAWHSQCTNFENGETVFTNNVNWKIINAATKVGERGDSIGIVPFPRPDSMDFDDPRYQQPNTAADCAGILKGISKEQTELAIKTFKLYFSTYYKELSGGEKATDYLKIESEEKASQYGLDLFHEEVGADMLTTFEWMAEHSKVNDFSQLTNIYYGKYSSILGDSLYGLNGMPTYEVAIEANLGILEDYINDIMRIIKSNEIRDNIAPKIKLIKRLDFAKGTDAQNISWDAYIEVVDNADGPIDLNQAMIDFKAIDFNQVGVQQGGLTVEVKDSSDNTAVNLFDIVIYDVDHTIAPTLTVKEEYRTIKRDEDVSEIQWGEDFLEEAVDKDGINIKHLVTVDLSTLDTTTKGVYPVELTVVDYVGNEEKVTIEVEVE